jgi:arylsulfatase A-like enzyme
MNLFGQAVLAGRRLLEAGGRVVSVFWDEYKVVNTAWDTHFNLYKRLDNELLPGLDSALSALIIDLEERGLLDDTLVLVLTEHGRSPKIIERANTPGRDHWSNAYCNLLSGAGLNRGQVLGSSDSQAAYVHSNPVNPMDILATMYHLVGIDAHTTIPDRAGRPVPLVADGRVLHELLTS